MGSFRLEFRRGLPPVRSPDTYVVCLFENNWDDWFKFETTFNLGIYKPDGSYHSLGEIKIGQKGLGGEKRRPEVPSQFDEGLGGQFFSLGQGESYYEAIRGLGSAIAEEILKALRDCAFDNAIFIENRHEECMEVSLLRSIHDAEVTGRFHRLAHGNAKLTPYNFEFSNKNLELPLSLKFSVIPESVPPTNVHVIIGRNGVGKTYVMQAMQRALLNDGSSPFSLSLRENVGAASGDPVGFAGITAVSFSAFDEFKSTEEILKSTAKIKVDYVGLRDHGSGVSRTKTPSDLTNDWVKSLEKIRLESKDAVLRKVIESLSCDPIFSSLDVARYALSEGIDQARIFFGLLSSGHKIVLLTMTELVRVVGERTLVLLDEPEAHLHPPLLAAFIRSLSDLLVSRNGVAIIATHSPVILQEVPSECAWILNRSGQSMVAERPLGETFGENVGLISRAVFSLEVTESGYNSLIRKIARSNPGMSYDQLIEKFSGRLGIEGRSLLRVAMADGANHDSKK